ncbi:MAG: hypothetical protein CMI32_02510 [Opitutales bacterium]|nr:hypothetical protein [Opitutales bacterium]
MKDISSEAKSIGHNFSGFGYEILFAVSKERSFRKALLTAAAGYLVVVPLLGKVTQTDSPRKGLANNGRFRVRKARRIMERNS